MVYSMCIPIINYSDRLIISEETYPALLPSLAFSFRKFGKKKTFNMANMMKSLMRIIVHKVFPNLMFRNPSTYKSYTL